MNSPSFTSRFRSSSALTPPAYTLSTWSRTICAMRSSLIRRVRSLSADQFARIVAKTYVAEGLLLMDRYGRLASARMAARPHRPYRPGQRERSRQRQAVRRTADGDADLARLDDPRPGQAGERGPVGVQPERDAAGLARRQRHPGEPGEPPDRAARPAPPGRSGTAAPPRCPALVPVLRTVQEISTVPSVGYFVRRERRGRSTRTSCTRGRGRTRTAASGRPSCRRARPRSATAGRSTAAPPRRRAAPRAACRSAPPGRSAPRRSRARPPRRGRTPAPRRRAGPPRRRSRRAAR